MHHLGRTGPVRKDLKRRHEKPCDVLGQALSDRQMIKQEELSQWSSLPGSNEYPHDITR
jgi:hypothetical protein